jgi:hypothetical protein
MIFEQIKSTAKRGTLLPGTNYTVKGLGKRRGETALIYRVPSNIGPRRHYEKGVTQSEYERAYEQLVHTGEFSRKWFNDNLSSCAAEGPCNFIAIGKTFILLGIADSKRGKYTRWVPVKKTEDGT